MSFANAANEIAELVNHFHPGLQALQRRERSYVSTEPGCDRKLTGSIDLDSALRTLEPSASRWDYGVGIKAGAEDEILWIEIHPASTSEISVVLQKLEWLQSWLRQKGKPLNAFTRRFIWISSGKTKLSPTAAQKKRMAQKGLIQTGNHYRISC